MRRLSVLVAAVFIAAALSFTPVAEAQSSGWAQVRVTNQRVGITAQQYLMQLSSFTLVAGGTGQFNYIDNELELALYSLATIYFTDQSWGVELSINDQLQWEFGVRVGVFW